MPGRGDRFPGDLSWYRLDGPMPPLLWMKGARLFCALRLAFVAFFCVFLRVGGISFFRTPAKVQLCHPSPLCAVRNPSLCSGKEVKFFSKPAGFLTCGRSSGWRDGSRGVPRGGRSVGRQSSPAEVPSEEERSRRCSSASDGSWVGEAEPYVEGLPQLLDSYRRDLVAYEQEEKLQMQRNKEFQDENLAPGGRGLAGLFSGLPGAESLKEEGLTYERDLPKIRERLQVTDEDFLKEMTPDVLLPASEPRDIRERKAAEPYKESFADEPMKQQQDRLRRRHEAYLMDLHKKQQRIRNLAFRKVNLAKLDVDQICESFPRRRSWGGVEMQNSCPFRSSPWRLLLVSEVDCLRLVSPQPEPWIWGLSRSLTSLSQCLASPSSLHARRSGWRRCRQRPFALKEKDPKTPQSSRTQQRRLGSS